MVINCFNSIYIAIERADGNSAEILRLNMAVIAIKDVLYRPCSSTDFSTGISMISTATILYQLFCWLRLCET